jgi:hypothetical protein
MYKRKEILRSTQLRHSMYHANYMKQVHRKVIQGVMIEGIAAYVTDIHPAV